MWKQEEAIRCTHRSLEVVKVRKEKGHSEAQDRVRLGSSCESSDKRLPLCFGDCRLQQLAE